MPILEGTVKASYRALRTDLYANVKEFSSLNDIKAVFGVDQITPQNPLAYALFIMKQNSYRTSWAFQAAKKTQTRQHFQAPANQLYKY